MSLASLKICRESENLKVGRGVGVGVEDFTWFTKVIRIVFVWNIVGVHHTRKACLLCSGGIIQEF
jgi:hypothetical protein